MLEYPDIPKFSHPDANPVKVNMVQHWGFFTAEEVAERPPRLLCMDLDFGRLCSLNCPTCFRKSNLVDDQKYDDLTYEELLRVIYDALKMGLSQVKICGAGEPLEYRPLLQLARDLTARGVGMAVFTKGHVLGDDRHVARVFGEYGIDNAGDLCREFFELKTSFLVSLQSTDAQIQDQLVGGVKGYTAKRNRALELLAEAGFNKSMPTRLAICANPMVRNNFDGLFDIFVYARERNMLPVNAALMVSGKQIDYDFLEEHDVSPDEKEDLWFRLYDYNLVHGFNTIEQLWREGLSSMPGIHPCNQIAVGVYLTCNGTVVRCPGDGGEVPLGNVHDRGIIDIWKGHGDWDFTGIFNVGCPFKDGITLPEGMYDRVLSRLLDKYPAPAITSDSEKEDHDER